MQVWIRGEEDANPIKLRVIRSTDVADLLVEASGRGELSYLVNNTNNYNILHEDEILPRDTIVTDRNSTADSPFVVIKAKKKEADHMSSTVLQYFVAMFIFQMMNK